jgi:GH15 family glucan-1,4-alpha-glucosidase
MLSKSLSVVIMLGMSWSLQAVTNKTLMTNLETRIHAFSAGSSLIKSYPEHSQSYIYDQALAIIAFSNHGDKKNAKSLLNGLRKLQHKDGSLYFSYYMDGQSPYPVEGDKRFAGAIAWVAMAATTYQKSFHDREFYKFNLALLNYLSKQMQTTDINGQQVSAVRFGPSDISSTPWKENEVAALEHNIDTYAAFTQFSQINHDEKFQEKASEIKQFILSMWDHSRSHFWSGANLTTGQINKEELYLDNQTWSLLALDRKTLETLNTTQALNMNCDKFLVEHEGVLGFMDTKPANRPSKYKFVWSEGSLGQILAMKNSQKYDGESLKCKGVETSTLLENVTKMKKKDGGIAYATGTDNPDFTTSSSVAGTTWYYFAANGINPFKL